MGVVLAAGLFVVLVLLDVALVRHLTPRLTAFEQRCQELGVAWRDLLAETGARLLPSVEDLVTWIAARTAEIDAALRALR